jgi:hypothetical protein
LHIRTSHDGGMATPVAFSLFNTLSSGRHGRSSRRAAAPSICWLTAAGREKLLLISAADLCTVSAQIASAAHAFSIENEFAALRL